jgi:hypothetical protein
MGDVARLAGALAGVRRTAPGGLAEWRYHGRLVARQLDDAHVVIRADFDYRDSMLRQFPETFSVPARYLKHMMVVADLARGDAGAIEDALKAASQAATCPGAHPRPAMDEPCSAGSARQASRARSSGLPAGSPRKPAACTSATAS